MKIDYYTQVMTHTQSNVQIEKKLNYFGKLELFANEKCLKHYNADIIRKISRQYFASTKNVSSNIAVLEFGAGIGTLAIEFLIQNKIKPDCIEIDPEQIQIIKDRDFECFKSIEELTKKYNLIYTSNVLEHIENDFEIIKKLYQSLEKGGILAIYVPAFQCLWSEMDESVGHFRRYTCTDLNKKLQLAEFKVLSSQYVDSLGFFAWLFLRLKGYKTGNTSNLEKQLIFYDRFLYPISRAIDLLGCRYLFGKNVLALAKK